jgi:cytidine deaminase
MPVNEAQRKELVKLAHEAQAASYSPYSKYKVGAALITKSGKHYLGTNIENAAYPTSICAERVAIFKAVSEGEREFEAIAVVTRDGGSPCGSCRQVMAEFAIDAQVFIANEKGEVVEDTSVRKLLPFAFLPGNLNITP